MMVDQEPVNEVDASRPSHRRRHRLPGALIVHVVHVPLLVSK